MRQNLKKPLDPRYPKILQILQEKFPEAFPTDQVRVLKLGIHKDIKENTAVISLGKDWSAGMNAFAKVAKTDKSISFKMGYLDKTPYDAVSMVKLSNLPSKSELMAKIIGSMKSPITHFVNNIKFPTQKFVMVLNAKVKKG